MKKLAIFIFSLLIITISCNTKTKEKPIKVSEAELENHPGKVLMANNCYSCHAPGGGEQNRVAPPMHAIKMHYLDGDISKEQFVNDILNFHENPVAENSKMPHAIEKFGIMPKFGFPEKDIKQIAEYMYLSELTENLKPSNDNTVEKTTAEKGLGYAMSTKQQLGKNLMNAIKTEGTAQAISFCNIHAYPITDSLAKVYDLNIKRVSDKPRNPNNAANETELAHIEVFKSALAEGKEVESIVEETNTEVNFYYPIITNGMCLQCHGKEGENIDEATLTQLNKLYPNDKARGYAIDQVRGIWSISWKKEG